MKEESLFGRLLIYLMTIFFVITNLLYFRFADFLQIVPMIDLMAVFYFSIYRQIFPIWFLFLIGLWNDSITNNILGVTSFLNIFLVKFFLILNERLIIRDNFVHIWYQFAIFSILFLLIKWFILSSFYGDFFSILWPITNWFISVIFYFIMHRFFDYVSFKVLRNFN